MTDTENWKAVPDYEGVYEVSDLGRIQSTDRAVVCASRWGGTTFRRFKSKILKPFDNGHGYGTVHLAVDGARAPKLVHRIVAEAFLPKMEGKDFVNHIDGDKSNNAASNLEWCTRSENMQHAHDNGLINPSTVSVVGTCLRTGAEVYYASQSDAEIALSSVKRPTSAIYRCIADTKKTAYGYAWRLA